MATRNVLLKYLRVQIRGLPQSARPSPFALSPNVLLRGFSEEVKGCFLDKSEVTDRVISAVKNFQKVDPSKVISCYPKYSSISCNTKHKMLSGILRT
ncbi:hypothetical protein L6164_010688 [Bauhinia variegata]|uniref:Uncharacterized protein n=1 Tax=Bauhinia variegata TaxID=167791 RepID=A0ACB9PNS3_BAUVA|nr:hypothetical protein L6164_010688 [Bauhinia variegata]